MTGAPGTAILLRPMRWWDVALLPPIDRALFGADGWSAEQFWSELAGVPRSRWYAVLARAEEIVGYAGLGIAGETAEVQTMAVRPTEQGRGLGARLLDALLAEAARRGATEIFLEVRRDNVPARGLYAAREFTQVAVRARYYGDETDALVLRRSLP